MAQDKKDRFIHEDGVTKTPYPIYPREIRDEPESLGIFGNKKIEDYLHLYINGKCMIDDKYEGWIKNYLFEGKRIKPILRPLSDMSEEEKIMLCSLSMPNGWQGHELIENDNDDMAALRIKRLNDADEFEYKSLYIQKKKIETHIFLWLLSKHFDLFNLHEAGLCLYKTDLK